MNIINNNTNVINYHNNSNVCNTNNPGVNRTSNNNNSIMRIVFIIIIIIILVIGIIISILITMIMILVIIVIIIIIIIIVIIVTCPHSHTYCGGGYMQVNGRAYANLASELGVIGLSVVWVVLVIVAVSVFSPRSCFLIVCLVWKLKDFDVQW